MTRNRLFWLVFALIAADYLVMIAWSIPHLKTAAGGLAIFDMRPKGYSLEEARDLLAALSPKATRFYLDVQQSLDTAFPALLAVALGWAILRTAPRNWGILRYLLAAPALPAAVFDYWENANVRAMLKAGADGVTPEMVANASLHSQLKAGFSALAMGILLVLLVLWANRRRQHRGKAV